MDYVDNPTFVNGERLRYAANMALELVLAAHMRRRTGLALFVLALAAAKAADVVNTAVVAVLGVVVSLAALLVVFAASHRITRDATTSAWTLLATSAGLVVGVAVVGAVLALTA